MKGSLDLVLLVAVLAAAWTRTPVGAVAESVVATWRGTERPDVFASFRTSLPKALEESIDRIAAPPPTASTLGPALRMAIAARLGDEALEALDDAKDPEAALEAWAIGADARARAIGRAKAAGSDDPESYEAHRSFLAAEQQRKADRAVRDVLSLATALDLAWPVDPSARVTSGFGDRNHPVLGVRKVHEGVDIAVPTGTPVHAAGPGAVRRAREDGVNGRYVSIDHGHDVTTAYCHASRLLVEEKEHVERGALILESGATGRATGPHLHFGLRIRGRAVDPEQFRGATPRPGSPR